MDVVTGRMFTVPKVDLFLPGPLALVFERAYSTSARERDIGLGYGWSHSLAWEITVERHSVTVWSGDGRAIEFPWLDPWKSAIGRDGWVLRREPDGYVVNAGDGVVRHFFEPSEGGKRFRLTTVDDANGNRITLQYDKGRLIRLFDSVGRLVRLQIDRAGRVVALHALGEGPGGEWATFATYSYDNSGNLIASTDADGYTITYGYLEEHLLSWHRDPVGLVFHFRYDAKDRCIETWGDYGDKLDPSIFEGAPRLLADGTTRAKGVLHCVFDYAGDAYTEVADSVRVERYFGNRFGTISKVVSGGAVTVRDFDALGQVTSVTDPLDATTRFKRDERGRVLEMIDALGRSTKLNRDELGWVVEIVDPAGGRSRAERDRAGNIRVATDAAGAVTSYRYNRRGQLIKEVGPTGATTRFERDAHGNVVRLVQPNGALWTFTYDAFGRRTSAQDPLGGIRRFTYSARGDLLAVQLPNGGVQRYRYDGAGHLIESVDPVGRTRRYTWGGFNLICAMEQPDGSSIQLHYNREGWPVEVVNERGDRHLIEYDSRGAVIAERTFDGRRLRFKNDLMGRRVRYTNGVGTIVDYERDPLGRITKRLYDDGTEESFEYDVLGRLAAARNGDSEVLFERDAVGRVVREVQKVGDEVHFIERAFNLAGKRVRRRTSLGHQQEIERDAWGNVGRSTFDGRFEVLHARDALGQETTRHLPGGGVIESSLDVMGWLVERRAGRASASPRVRPGEPDWVGPRRPDWNVDLSFAYSLAGDLARAWSGQHGATSFGYDRMGQIFAVIPEQAVPIALRFDPAGNMSQAPSGEICTYGPGNRLLQKGTTHYAWDGAGRLLEKRTPGADGRDDVTALTWNARGLLERVRTPGGAIIELVYDALARRVAKRVLQPSLFPGRSTLKKSVRFVWDGDVVVHEIQRNHDSSPRGCKTYVFEEDSFAPAAHQDAQLSDHGLSAKRWFYYVNDQAGAPVVLLNEDGSVAAQLDRNLFGSAKERTRAATTTPIRLQGQYEDEETGLSYNRHRYYDPEIGRFISPDPIGLNGGLNAFTYGLNPLVWVDPFGLHTATATATPQGGASQSKGFNSEMDGPEYNALCKQHGVDPADNSGGHQRQLCHTEQKGCEWAKDKVGAENGHLLINDAQLPPCNNCKGAMNKFAAENNATIRYEYSGPDGSGVWETNPEKGAAATKRRKK